MERTAMSKEKFSRYDTADYLKTDGDVARARNMSQLARDTGMTREGLYKALSGDGNPSFATVIKVAHALGLRMAFKPSS
jgi:probable addiction module antidote protein